MDYENNVKRVIPMIMLVFISSATMISVINIIYPQLTVDFGISPTTVSLLSMTVMLMMGVASVAYSTLSNSPLAPDYIYRQDDVCQGTGWWSFTGKRKCRALQQHPYGVRGSAAGCIYYFENKKKQLFKGGS